MIFVVECPREDVLLDLVDGRLDAGALGELHRHADACAGCRELMAALARRAPPGERHAEPAIGETIAQYRIERRLGRGGMGAVFLARDTRLGRRVAIKFLLDHRSAHTERFLVEARATARCNHENIVVIYEVDEHQGVPYLVLEYLEGATLADEIAKGPLPIGRAVELMLPVARALVRAHADGIVHRDLKPDNIFLTTSGVTKVLDFGIAKLRSGDDDAGGGGEPAAPVSVHETRNSAIMGTPPYMSPEHWGRDTIDARSDLFAVGIMMYQLVSGRHPLAPLTIEHLTELARELDTPIPSVGTRDAAIPERFARLVDRCIAKRKADRPANARELEQELEALRPSRAGRPLADGESPYPGLTAFQEHDADRFFGRSADVARALARLREAPLVAVVGASGIGKSSFVRAGVIPALRGSGDPWETHVIRPGRAPLATLARLLGPRGDEAQLAREPGVLASLLRERAERTGARVLLFVDQFEELYTLVADAEARGAFTACLAGLVDDAASPLRLVLSMRSDLLDRVAEDPRFTDQVTRGLLLLRPLDRAGLHDAVVQPLEALGYRCEDASMVEQMVDALATTSGALPLLQFAAAK